jgi:ubiquinone/menaquinone biosynthesis C-methylase UbiE
MANLGNFLEPEEVLKELKLQEDIVVADFGCGSGGWAIPLAKQIIDGKVYAIDILQEPLSALRMKAKTEEINNIATVLADVERGTDLLDESLDLVLLTNLLFQVDDKKKVLSEAKRVIKPGARILIVDWQPKAQMGPKEGRVDVEEIKKIAQELGLSVEKEFAASPYHYGLILVK